MSTSIEHRWNRLLWPMVLCILLLIPVLSALWSGGLIGLDERIGDRANTLWLHWYATYEWSLFESFGQTNVFLYPEGVNLWAELFNVVDAFIAIPFVWLFGWGPHYWMIAAIMVANLWAGNSMQLCGPLVPAYMVGCFYLVGTSSMWHAIEMGRVLQVMVGVIPLSMWALTRLREQGDWRRGLVWTLRRVDWKCLFILGVCIPIFDHPVVSVATCIPRSGVDSLCGCGWSDCSLESQSCRRRVSCRTRWNASIVSFFTSGFPHNISMLGRFWKVHCPLGGSAGLSNTVYLCCSRSFGWLDFVICLKVSNKVDG